MNVLNLLRSCWNDWSFAVTALIGVLAIAVASLVVAVSGEEEKRETISDRDK